MIINYRVSKSTQEPHEQSVASESQIWIHLDTCCLCGALPLDVLFQIRFLGGLRKIFHGFTGIAL